MNIEKLLDTADIMVATQQYNKALSIYNQIIDEDATCDEAYLMRGALYGELGQKGEALKDILTAIDIDPEYDGAHLTLALLYKSQGELKKAIISCERAIRLNKNNKEAIQHIINLYTSLADQQLSSHLADKAVENYRRASQYAAGNAQILYKLAFSLSRTGQFDQAAELAEKILSQNRNYLPAIDLLTSIYEKTGQVDKGWELAESVVEQYPNNVTVAITYGKYALRKNKQTSAIEKLSRFIGRSDIKDDDRLSVHMLLGKLYDSIYEYEDAFSQFKKANDLKYNDYQISDFKQHVDSIISFFSRERYSGIASSTIDSEKPVFILGMPRSGTSLIEQIIGSHSQVYAAGELQNINKIALKIDQPGGQYPSALETMSVNTLNNYASDLLQLLDDLSEGEQKVSDKLPHNFLFIGLIHKLFPKAKIINCLRDPVDNCLSCYFQHFGGYHPYAYDLTNLAKYYLQYTRLMKHWQDELEIPILNIHYEDVVHSTKQEVEKILSYLGLGWEERCLEFYNQKRAVHTASYAQVSKKIYTGSVKRWLDYKHHITELTDILKGGLLETG